ncbi:MAG: hypothetical protein IJS17_03280, partial [Clostridia bacterium]|nr:hypothetical protein [Clostridia bacterium]
SPIKTVCEKSVSSIENFLGNKNRFIVVCQSGSEIVASCEVSIQPSLAFSSGGTVFVCGVCFASEKDYDSVCLLISKVREIAFRRKCKKIICLNENCSGFLNSVYMSSGLRREEYCGK